MFSASICGHQMDTEFGYYYTGAENVSPEVQSNFVEVLGMSGTLDLTEQDGSVFYSSVDREWRFEKVTRTTSEDDIEAEARSLRKNILKAGNVIFDSDPNYYYSVRVTKVDVSCEDGGRLVAIVNAHCQPYKYRVLETEVTKNVSDTEAVVLSNEEMAVSPLVITDSEMSLDYTIKGVSYHVAVSSGQHIIDTLVLYEGNTTITVSGTGTITFRYRQGAL